MALNVAHDGFGQQPAGLIKIGAVARHFGVSVDLLRLYEREGLLIPWRSPGDTRYYTTQDYLWIQTILRLVREARLNFAGIRRLVALLPCWQVKNCGLKQRQSCQLLRDATLPCWSNRACCLGRKSVHDCYFCPVYRAAPQCENLRALLLPSTTGVPGRGA